MPVSTGADARSRAGAVPEGPKSDPVSREARNAAGPAGSASEEAATVAIRARRGTASPLPSGWTRFERMTTNNLVAGSIQIDVPVNPVWPNEPTGSSSPRLLE